MHSDQKGFILETAHPVKFPDAVEQAIGENIVLPSELEILMKQEKKSVEMSPDFVDLKTFLLQKIN